MAQIFPKAEGRHAHLHRPPSHTGGNLPRQQACRRPRQEHLHPIGVQYPTDEGLPTGHHLNLIQKENHLFPSAAVGKQQVILFHNELQVVRTQSDEPFVLEAEEE
jgi:hypothetical protein